MLLVGRAERDRRPERDRGARAIGLHARPRRERPCPWLRVRRCGASCGRSFWSSGPVGVFRSGRVGTPRWGEPRPVGGVRLFRRVIRPRRPETGQAILIATDVTSFIGIRRSTPSRGPCAAVVGRRQATRGRATATVAGTSRDATAERGDRSAARSRAAVARRAPEHRAASAPSGTPTSEHRNAASVTPCQRDRTRAAAGREPERTQDREITPMRVRAPSARANASTTAPMHRGEQQPDERQARGHGGGSRRGRARCRGSSPACSAGAATPQPHAASPSQSGEHELRRRCSRRRARSRSSGRRATSPRSPSPRSGAAAVPTIVSRSVVGVCAHRIRSRRRRSRVSPCRRCACAAREAHARRARSRVATFPGVAPETASGGAVPPDSHREHVARRRPSIWAWPYRTTVAADDVADRAWSLPATRVGEREVRVADRDVPRPSVLGGRRVQADRRFRASSAIAATIAICDRARPRSPGAARSRAVRPGRSSAKCVPSATPIGAPTLRSPSGRRRRDSGGERARDPTPRHAGERRGENHDDDAERRADASTAAFARDPGIELELATDADRETARQRDRDACGEHRARSPRPGDSGARRRHGAAVGAPQRAQRGCVAIVPALLGPDQDPRGDRADECDADAEREERDRLDADRTLERLPTLA